MGRGQRGGDYEKGKKKRALSAEVFLFFLIYIGKTNDNNFFIKRLYYVIINIINIKLSHKLNSIKDTLVMITL